MNRKDSGLEFSSSLHKNTEAARTGLWKRSPKFYFILFLILAGIFVRFVDLGTHFTNIDDIGPARTLLYYFYAKANEGDLRQSIYEDEKASPVEEVQKNILKTLDQTGNLPLFVDWSNRFYRMTAVSRHWTYAPLQFFATYFLVHLNQSYREKIFWGRFPSFVFGVGAFFALLGFYKRYNGAKTPSVLLVLSLLAFSWENIIYAKQMESYSIGVLAAVLVLILLIRHAKCEKLSLRHAFFDAVLFALLVHAQYQVLFFIPSYFLTLLLLYRKKMDLKPFLLAVFVAGAAFAVLMLPLYLTTLRFLGGAGVTASSSGLSGEFKFTIPEGDFAAKTGYAVRFFLSNFFIVFSTTLGFIPEESVLFLPLSCFFLGLMLLGIWKLIRFHENEKKMLLNFFSGLAIVWIGLVVSRKLTFSPTRQALILLPFMSVIIGEGWDWIVVKARFLSEGKGTKAGWYLIPVLIASCFFFYFPGMVKSRQDPFHEDEIRNTLISYGVDTIIAADWTWNLTLMRNIANHYHYFEEEWRVRHIQKGIPYIYRTIAYISQRAPLDPVAFERLQKAMNLKNPQKGVPYWTRKLDQYEIIYSREIRSDVEIEFSKRTKNGSNNLFLTILKRKEE